MSDALGDRIKWAVVDALNSGWDGGAYGSIIESDIVDLEVGLETTTFELSDVRADYSNKYRTLPTSWVLTLLLKSIMKEESL